MIKNFASLLSIIFIVQLIACDKDPYADYQNPGLITGPDYRRCLCCGGHYIEILDTTYRFQTLPENSTIQLPTEAEKYPIQVYLDWKLMDKQCLGDEIEVLRIIEVN